MTIVERLASYVERVSFTDLDGPTCERLKVSVLDALGCAIGAMGGEPIHQIRKLTDEFGGAPLCSLVGGGRTTPERAAFYNSALVRYLDFNDSYLAPEETCHPSDNLGAVIAATEYAHGTGSDLLTALGIAYEVQCRLSEAAPVRKRGFDHTTQGAYALAAGTSKALGLKSAQIAHALAIAGTALNALRVTRTGALSNWKGLAFPYTAWGAVQAVFLARAGITGPLEVFEGNKGFMEAIAGRFDLNWDDREIRRAQRVIHKKFNAEIHSQATLETVLELKRERKFGRRRSRKRRHRYFRRGLPHHRWRRGRQ